MRSQTLFPQILRTPSISMTTKTVLTAKLTAYVDHIAEKIHPKIHQTEHLQPRHRCSHVVEQHIAGGGRDGLNEDIKKEQNEIMVSGIQNCK